MGLTRDRTDAAIRFAPARRFRHWPVAVLGLGAGLFVMWIAGLPDLLRDLGGPEWPARLLALGLPAAVPILCAILALCVPLRRWDVTVTPQGLHAVTARGPRAMHLPLAALDRITLHRGRGRHCLAVRPAHGTGRRVWWLGSDSFDGTARDVLAAIRDLAPAAGFRRAGHRLDIAHMGGKIWRLQHGAGACALAARTAAGAAGPGIAGDIAAGAAAEGSTA